MRKSVRPGKSRWASEEAPKGEFNGVVERGRKVPALNLGRFVSRALFKGLVGGLLFASPFLVIAAVYWSSAEARGILLYIASCFAFCGFLAGVGMELARTFGKGRHEPSRGDGVKEATGDLAEQLMPDPFGSFWKVAKIITWLVRKDYRAQAPDRGKRALLGAIVLGFVAVVFFGMLLLVHKGFSGYSVTESLLLLLGAFLGGGAVGAVLGALSDSF